MLVYFDFLDSAIAILTFDIWGILSSNIDLDYKGCTFTHFGSIKNHLVVVKDSPPKGDAYGGENIRKGGLANEDAKEPAAKRQSFVVI